MKARLLAAGLLVAAGANVASAQSSQCSAGATEDACQKSIDLFNYMAPQLGTSIAGGNAQLGQGGTLGGLGHFAVGLRANAIRGTVPDAQNFSLSTSGRQQSDLGAKNQFLGAPALEAGFGVFKGLPLGLTNVGGVDLLVSASYLPEYRNDDIRVSLPDGSFKFGYGARVGLLSESFLIPGISVTYLKRDLPTVNVQAAVDGASTERDTIGVSGLSLKTTAWRVVASKKLLVFGLALGAGQDRYESEASVSADVAVPVAGGPLTTRGRVETNGLTQTMTRTNYFADLSFNLFAFRGVAEIGRVSGGDATTFNSFGDVKASDPRMYGSLGFKFGF